MVLEFTSDRKRFDYAKQRASPVSGLVVSASPVSPGTQVISLSTWSSAALVSVHSPEMVVSNIGGCVQCSCSGLVRG